MLRREENKLIYEYDGEQVFIEPWGDHSVRVRATREPDMPKDNWALCEVPSEECDICILDKKAILTNGKIRVEISRLGKLTIYNQKNELILEEYVRNRRDLLDEKCSAMEIGAREFKPIIGGIII